MQEAFPELSRIRGTVILSNGWERHHWWLLDGEEIVDPTKSQFQQPFYGEGLNTSIIGYFPRDESEPEPTGLCPNCGGYCYDEKSVCSDRCGDAYAAYLNSPHML